MKEQDLPTSFVELLQVVKPQKIVEIGSWLGESCIAFCNASRQIGLKTQPQILCIDTWLGSYEHWNKPLTGKWSYKTLNVIDGEPRIFDDFKKNIEKSGFRKNISYLRCPSGYSRSHLRDSWSDAQLIYIDGDHSVVGVCADIRLALDSLPHSLISGDDFDWLTVRYALSRMSRKFRLRILVAKDERTWVLCRPLQNSLLMNLKKVGWIEHSRRSLYLEYALIQTKTKLVKFRNALLEILK